MSSKKILAKKKAELACLGEHHLHENIKKGGKGEGSFTPKPPPSFQERRYSWDLHFFSPKSPLFAFFVPFGIIAHSIRVNTLSFGSLAFH